MRDFQEIQEIIIRLASEIQSLVDDEFRKCNDIPLPDSALDQAGLRDGKEVVINYVNFNEFGLAVEHLIYMVSETGIDLTPQTRNELQEVADRMRIKQTF